MPTPQFNSGKDNTGWYNAGNKNTGHYNQGDNNIGKYNWGNSNVGDNNLGDGNVGECNTSSFNVGLFNTTEPTIRLFNQNINMSRDDFWRSGIMPIVKLDCTKWIYYNEMTDKEKQEHPLSQYQDGYLQTFTYHEAWARWWSWTSEENRQKILNLPNFDAVIFKEITGIDLDNFIPLEMKPDRGEFKYKVGDIVAWDLIDDTIDGFINQVDIKTYIVEITHLSYFGPNITTVECKMLACSDKNEELYDRFMDDYAQFKQRARDITPIEKVKYL